MTADITPEPTADERLAEITNRNRRLRGASFSTHGTRDGCPACELVRGVDDVEWLLAENQRLREERVGAGMPLNDVSAELIEAAWQACGKPKPAMEFVRRTKQMLAAVLPLHEKQTRERVADDIEVWAEGIGWYEDGGVWAEAIDVARTGRRHDENGGDPR